MAKRRIISFLMLCAFAIVQMHNLMPHHHDDDHSSRNVRNHGHHHQDNDHRSAHQTSPFDDIEHSSEFGSAVIKTENGNIIIQKPVFSESIVAQLYVYMTLCNGPPLKPPPVINSPLFNTFYSYRLPLRAPPALPSLI